MEFNTELFHNDECYNLYKYMGSHKTIINDKEGVIFRVWIPLVKSVSVVGDFNNWDRNINKMYKIDKNIWEVFIQDINEYSLYKYSIETSKGDIILKSDPYAFLYEQQPEKASIYVDINNYKWNDKDFQANKSNNTYNKPINIYEVHLGSWKRNKDNSYYSYKQLTDELIPYVKEMNYNYIELMPITEYPYDGSWGYQVIGYFAPTSRYGNPYDLMTFIDKCHQENISVILDWIPAHFPKDSYSLSKYNGTTSCYEYDDPRKSEHKDWNTLVFNYEKKEVINFLISSAMFWMDYYHIDGLRVDAVSSMIYLDYGRRDGEWIPNKYGGKENLEAIEFIHKLNNTISKYYPNNIMIAEEASDYKDVTKPTYESGLGFNYKWNMGFMYDMFHYMSLDSIYRSKYHNELTFSLMYAFSENFILPISHDEVVHCKASVINKTKGFIGMKAFIAYMMAHPGKKLTFMGTEFGQYREWDYNKELDWYLLNNPENMYIKNFFKYINKFYIENKPLWDIDNSWKGFQWISCNNSNDSIISFRRIDGEGNEIIAVCNFQNKYRNKYSIGVPYKGIYKEVLNTQWVDFGGSEMNNKERIKTNNFPINNYNQSIEIKIPSLSVSYYKCIYKGRLN